jgi:hypothetical protein
MGGITDTAGVFFSFALSILSATHLIAKSGGHVFYIDYQINKEMKKLLSAFSYKIAGAGVV